jgi:asparagine synthase (glutamine-hydrolysing)
MAVSLEAREPLLDHRLVEFAASLPANFRLRGGTGKWLMKKSLERHLPHEILYRRKMGFVTPISAWFRGPLADTADAIARSSAWPSSAGSTKPPSPASPRNIAPAAPITAACSGSS